MNEKKYALYLELLNLFDQLKLNTIHERRTAHKPLYDYFLKIILVVGVNLCCLNQNSLKISHLKTRWENVKSCLNDAGDIKRWDSLINEMNHIRNAVEHDDDYDPSTERLITIRKEAPEFTSWLMTVSNDYYKKSVNFTFKESFFHIAMEYIRDAERIIDEYGENIPYAAKLESENFIEYPYTQISKLSKKVQETLKSIKELEDIKPSDLEDLIFMVVLTSHFKGREDVLRNSSICPKCGGAFMQTSTSVGGGTEEQPEPDYLHIRVGCQKCDYVLFEDTISI